MENGGDRMWDTENGVKIMNRSYKAQSIHYRP